MFHLIHTGGLVEVEAVGDFPIRVGRCGRHARNSVDAQIEYAPARHRIQIFQQMRIETEKIASGPQGDFMPFKPRNNLVGF